MDPCVLSVVAKPGTPGAGVDLSAYGLRVVLGNGVEHVRIVVRDVAFRLDVCEGSIADEPVRLTYLLAQDKRLPRHLATISRLDHCLSGFPVRSEQGSVRLSRMANALRVLDARATGASLRQIANELWGPDEWPGPGEHRKSAVRRYVAMGEKLMSGGAKQMLLTR